MPQLREKPHLGVPSSNPALYLGHEVCNSTTALGLRAALHLERIRSRSTGKERDAESGNDYFDARYYGSSMGRFLSADSGEDQDVEDPQSWNLYSYVRNNPLTNSDPDGHDCVVQQRVDETHETIAVSPGDCQGKGTGSGQSATYVPGRVDPGAISAAADGHSINIGYTTYDGQSSGVTNAGGAPVFDHPGIDGEFSARPRSMSVQA